MCHYIVACVSCRSNRTLYENGAFAKHRTMMIGRKKLVREFDILKMLHAIR